MRCWDKCFRARTRLTIFWIWGESQQLLDQAAWRRRGAAAMSGQGVRTRRGAEPWAAPCVPRGPFFPLGTDEGFGKVPCLWAVSEWKKMVEEKVIGSENLKHWGNAPPCDFFDVWGQLCEEWAVDGCPSKANVCCVLFFILKSKQQRFFLHSLCQHMGKAYVSGCSIAVWAGAGRPFYTWPFLLWCMGGREGKMWSAWTADSI